MIRRAVLVCALLVGSAAAALAQVSATTGSINGKVADATGGVLPGVTVTAESPAMQGIRTTVTDDQGSYRFPAVPPGDYRVTYELTGFTTVIREGIRVGIGFTATINIDLKVATLQETVTVSGESPVVDVTSTATATSFGEERLAALPNARDFWTVLAAAPAIVVNRIDVAGSAAGTQTGYSAYDTKTDQHRPMVEGIVNTEGTGAAGYYYDYGSIDEVAVETKGHTAEMPWPGVWSNFVAKSGGNEYHGKVYADYQHESIQARNVDDGDTFLCPRSDCGNLVPSDLNRLFRYHDINADVGGFIKKDKLWWYFSTRDQNIKVLVPNFPVKPFETSLRNLSGKVTYALTANNKITGYAQGGRKVQPNRLDTFLIGATAARHETADSTWRQQYWGHTYKAGYESVLSDAMFLELRGGQFRYIWPNFRYTEAPAFADLGTNIVRGGNRDGWFLTPARNQAAGSLTYFKDGWGGDHNFKVGFEIFRETRAWIRGKGVNGVVPNDVLHVLNNGVPSEVVLFQTPSESENGLWTHGVYLQDQWRVTPRLTLNLGLRFDRYRAFHPDQQGPPVGKFNATQIQFPANDNLKTYNHPVPRVGATYDLSGRGTTVLKATYGRYYWNPGTTLAEDINNNSPDWWRRHVWTDLNGNGVWDAGEEGRLNSRRGGEGSASLDPDLVNQLTDEAAFWLEHELVPGLGLHAGYVYRRIDNLNVLVNANRPIEAYNVPITIRDPGPDGRLNTSDDGPGIPGFNLNPANLTLPVLNRRTNLEGTSEFHTIELSATKRQSGRWSVQASGSIRLNRDNDTGYFGQSLRSVQAPSTRNDFINTDDGRYHFTAWTMKFNGTYEAPYGLRITPALRVQSGQPFGRTFLAGSANGINYGTQRILAEPMGTRTQDHIVILDTRVEKVIRLPKGQTVAGFFDVYNITNSSAAQNINWGSGATFLQPTSIVGPTILRVGLKFDW
jgi:hypothetical protein